MDSEIFLYRLMDETMDINHQIMGYIIKVAEADLRGVKIKGKENIGLKQLEKNEVIKTLFERLQKKYREMEEIIKNNMKIEQQEDEIQIDLHYFVPQSVQENEEIFQNNFENDEIAKIIKELQEYLKLSYENLRYIEVKNQNDEILQNSIYSRTDFNRLHELEYIMQADNLADIETRVRYDNENCNLTPQEKANILDWLASDMFCKKLGPRILKRHLEKIDKEKENIDPYVYKYLKTKLYEIKYDLIVSYLYQKYNGMVQINDNKKLSWIQNSIDNIDINMVLNMDTFDITENLKIRINEYEESLREELRELEMPIAREIIVKKRIDRIKRKFLNGNKNTIRETKNKENEKKEEKVNQKKYSNTENMER